jgi:hypothetical protein
MGRMTSLLPIEAGNVTKTTLSQYENLIKFYFLIFLDGCNSPAGRGAGAAGHGIVVAAFLGSLPCGSLRPLAERGPAMHTLIKNGTLVTARGW